MIILVGLMVFAVTSVHASVTAFDAVLFVSEENHFLLKSDEVEQPIVPIVHDGKKYWVVPVIRGTDVVTFIPIPFTEKKVSENQPVNDQLYSTAFFLRSYLTYKNSLATQNKKWFLGSDNQLILEQLATSLNDGIYRLNIVKSDLPQNATEITSMQADLAEMSSQADGLSDAIFEFVQTENQFVAEPDTKNLSSIKEQQAVANQRLFELEAQARAYKSKAESLKLAISKATLTADKKNNFIRLADPPADLYTIGSTSIGNWVILANDAQTQVANIYNQSKSKSFLEEAAKAFVTRNNQNNTFNVLWGIDEEFKKKTPYPTLDTAIRDITSDEKKLTWANQEQLQEAYSNWQRAVEAFDQSQYETAALLANKSKRAVERVISSGTIEEEPNPVNYGTLLNIAIIVLILVIVFYFVKNRDKILGTGQTANPDQGVDLDAWKKY